MSKKSKSKPMCVEFADSHLRHRLRRHRGIYGDSYFSFQQIVDYAIKHELPLIGAGDLIDQRVNEPSPIVTLEKELGRLRKAGLTLYYVQGQHEGDTVPWLSIGGDTAVHIHKQVIELGDLRIYGLDFQPAGRLQEELAAIPPDVNMGCFHQTWGDWMGSVALPQGEFADLPEQIRFLLTGDYHETITGCYRGAAGQPVDVFSPGSTCMQSTSEPPEKYFGVRYEDGSVQRVKLRTRHFAEYLLNRPEDLDEFLGHVDAYLEGAADYAEDVRLPPALHAPLWKITYSPRLSDVVRRIERAVDGRAHLFWKKLRPAAEDDSDAALLSAAAAPSGPITLEGCLAEEVDPAQEPEVYTLCQRLLTAAAVGRESAQKELETWKQEQLQAEPVSASST